MAATRLMPLHINKGWTLAQSLNDRTDYAKNPEKTQKGELVTAYECDPITVDEDFLLSKRQYEVTTGRQQKNDVIAYHIRQSFKPGEVSPEEANQIGRELALRFTKGKHAFIVATHTDKAHIHNHIIFNSTTIDGSKKFHNFFLSYLAVQKISDRLCVEHGLSIIEARPYRDRQKRTDYPAEPTFRDIICESIDQALSQKPADFEAFLHLVENSGYEIKRGKNIALKGKGQQRFIRLRSLGEGYSEEEICAAIAGEREHQPKKRRKEKTFSAAPPRLQLLIDVQAKIDEGKGEGYARWAKTFNLKQMAEAVCFIKEHDIATYDELSTKADAAVERFDALSDSIKSAEKRLTEIAALKKHIFNYSRTRDTFAAYKKSGYSRKFLEEHREEITIHRAAKAAFDQLENTDTVTSANGKQRSRIPSVKELNREYAEVLSGKKKAYSEYRAARREMQDLLIARKTIDTILDIDRDKDMEKDKRIQNNL
ncbi:MAG: relaxase/mobilization nuclease domain-containing protein [Clostridiales bacterium]|nr:relaxase/mobilization nuclease domain-containing protein [Clostridiales bacterium]